MQSEVGTSENDDLSMQRCGHETVVDGRDSPHDHGGETEDDFSASMMTRFSFAKN